jgi:multidrug resistance efflux pump
MMWYTNITRRCQDKKKTMDSMISKEIYKRDMDQVKAQHQQSVQDVQRERDAERNKLEGEKKKLEDDIAKIKADLKKATTDGVITGNTSPSATSACGLKLLVYAALRY